MIDAGAPTCLLTETHDPATMLTLDGEHGCVEDRVSRDRCGFDRFRPVCRPEGWKLIILGVGPSGSTVIASVGAKICERGDKYLEMEVDMQFPIKLSRLIAG